MSKYLKSTDYIQFNVREGVARITLNRPEKRNALSLELVDELHDALLEADALVAVKVIIIAGAGKDFSAGYNLGGGGVENTEEANYRKYGSSLDNNLWFMEEAQRRMRVLLAVHKPVIAKVHGHCLAGATDLALMCDMVIAADDAKIGFPATRANGTPPNHMWFYHVGPQWAKRMLMTGDSLWGRDAARIGLVLDATPANELDGVVDELARRVSCIDTELLALHKRVVNLALELSGGGILQSMATELDACSTISQGPRSKQFTEDVAAYGLKIALKNRDEPFGDGMVKVYSASR